MSVTPKKAPQVLQTQLIAQSQLFCIEQQSLRFTNGEERVYERLLSRGQGAVLVVPVLDKDHFLLIREWAAGTGRYELSFPKGRVDAGEDVLQAAQRECQEEVGYAAKHLVPLHAPLTLSPSYMSHQIQVVLAMQLYPQLAKGDEPEPLEVVTWRWDELDRLMRQPDFTEARSIAALWLAKRCLRDMHVFDASTD